jgi:hypothetical protein
MKFIESDDFLRNSLPGGSAPPDWLALRLLCEAAIRSIYFFHQEPFIAIAVDVRTTRLIERTALELIQDGLCLEGVYVCKRVWSKDRRIAPDTKTIGCVQSVEGSLLRLIDARDGIETVEASDVRPVKDVFARCLSHVFKERAPEVDAALERQRTALRQGPERLDRIRRILGFLGKEQHEMVPGTPFTFGPLLDNSMPLFPPLQTAPRPVYVFDETGSKTKRLHDDGLNEIWAAHCPRFLLLPAQNVRSLPKISGEAGRPVPSQILFPGRQALTGLSRKSKQELL